MQELGVTRFQYFSKLAQDETNLATKDTYLRAAEAGMDQFYEFIENKDIEKVENETKKAEEKLKQNVKDLAIVENEQKKIIDEIDKKFKDSSGDMRSNYVSDFRGFLTDIKPDITKLGVDLYNTFKEAQKAFDQNDKDAAKIGGSGVTTSTNNQSGSTPIYNTPSKSAQPYEAVPGFIGPQRPDGGVIPSSGSSSSNNQSYSTSTTAKTGETWDEMIARFKREDAAVTIANRKANGQAVPVYEQGTPYVPETGLAILHKGEMIVPASINSDLMNRGYTGFLANRAANNNYSTSSVNNSNQQTIIVKNEVVIQGNDTNQMRAEFNKFESKLTQQLTKLGIK